MPAPIDPVQVCAAVGASRRYRHVLPGLIARLAAEEIPKSRNADDAQKRTKRRLHQIFGAYATPLAYDRLLADLAAASDAGAFKSACGAILRQHASTAERMPELETFYRRIFEITGEPRSILDLACGLNPLTVPWMNLAPEARYFAADIDLEMVRFLGGFLKLAKVKGEAWPNDLVAGPPPCRADVAFLFKAVPCLMHQTNDVVKIFDSITADWLIVSFPTRSLGNRDKGMAQTYRTRFLEMVSARPWRVTELAFASELVFAVATAAVP